MPAANASSGALVQGVQTVCCGPHLPTAAPRRRASRTVGAPVGARVVRGGGDECDATRPRQAVLGRARVGGGPGTQIMLAKRIFL